jgi:hypothetical protein
VLGQLAQIGWVTLAQEMTSKLYRGAALSDSEQAIMDKLPGVTEQLLANIPRLEPVREILRYQGKHYDGHGVPDDQACGSSIPWGARALKAATDLDVLEAQGFQGAMALDALRARTGWYDPAILDALQKQRGDQQRDGAMMQLPLHQVQTGMIFAEDVKARSGLLLIARGQEVTPSLGQRIKNLALTSKISDPVLVILPPQVSSSPAGKP